MAGKNIEEIMRMLPHRFPMLLIDRVLDVEPTKYCVGLKNVSMNEAFFQGHYPGMPIMPGVLILEALAQCGAIIVLSSEEYQGRTPLIGAIDDVKFRRPVVPGDQLILNTEVMWIKKDIGRMKGEATVEGEKAAQMELTFKLLGRDAT
ncbi:MAG: 3-hydroxyacyl-ACP dehydratase FabZ [Fimbriimonadaceae bacterium]|nr:3-hydroxyacyl-ACP dehydratase FabZ [Fimbriimonadaceae bacterium]